MKLSIKRRIMLLYTLFSLVLLAVLIPVVYGTVSASLSIDIRSRLENAIAQVLIGADGLEEEKIIINKQVDLPDHIDLCLLDADGAVIFSTAEGEWLQQAEALERTVHRGDTYTVLQKEYQIEDNTITALAAVSSGYADQSLNNLRWLLYITSPVYLGLSAVGAYLLSRRAIRPIGAITTAAEAISAGDLSKRITGIRSRDEIQELADTFNTMLDRLQESFLRERQFTSDASHELRTPVAVISACAEELEGAVRGGEAVQNLAAIQRESARMNKIISQLLLLTRGYEGRYHVEKERLELHEAVGSVMEELSEMAASARIELFNKVPEGCTLYADQSLLTQLLINLIANSIKYGVPDGKVTVRADGSDNCCTFTVSDNGIGIRKEDLAHIFERFYRADKSRDRSGSGLGLSIVKWIVELHDGNIAVSSTYGRGTEITVKLPLKQQA